jgi:glutamine synthetase
MAKFDQREGNSCHIHMSLRGDDGRIVFDEGDGPTPKFRSFVAGIQATMCELTLLYAPNINSYKRFQAGSFAPTSTAWGYDNRTCSLRVVGHGAGLRLENRLPGGDVNPYLALAGMLASGLRGIDQELSSSRRTRATPTCPTTPRSRPRCGPPATCSPAPRWRARCSAPRRWTTSSTNADVELAAFGAASPTGSASAFERM